MNTLGIDLGGTYARAAVVDAEGKILAAAKAKLSDRAPPAVVEALGQAADEAVAAAGNPALGGCGVGVAGMLDKQSGVVLVGPNLGWRDVPFGALLSQRLSRKVKVVNDLSAAAWGELKAGAAKGASEVFVVYVGSGVGSALILHGELYEGATGVAGEFGHVKVVPNGRKCGCGERGCVEAYVGGHNLIDQMRELVAGNSSPSLAELCEGDPSKLTPIHLEQAALSANDTARALYDFAVGHLSVAIANQLTVLNPQKLLLGGGVLSRCPEMVIRIRKAVEAHTGRVAQRPLEIVEATLGDDSGLVGAALLARKA